MLGCAAIAASALAFALYARVAWPWLILGFVGLVPWLFVLDRARTLRGALAAAWLFSVAFSLAVFPWFARGVQAYAEAPAWLAFLALVLLAPILEPQLLVFALARRLARARGAGLARTTLVGACAWVGAEWALPKLFGDTLGHGLFASAWLRQAADLAGAPGLSFVLVVANECARAAIRAAADGAGPVARLRAALPPAACVGALVLGLLAYGALRWRQLEPGPGAPAPVRAGIVQADVAGYGRLRAQLGSFDAVRAILDVHVALSGEVLARGLDLLVWPETVYPTTFGSPKSPAGAAFDREIGAFVAAAGVPLVFGAYDVEGPDEFNAAFFLEPSADGRLPFDTYRKASLFPLTERVPAWLDSGLVRDWLPWLGTWQPGAGPAVLPLTLADGRRLLVAPLICYDAVDPGFARDAVRRGAELLVTLSNDSWFADGLGPHLHLVVSAFRSLETRRPQVRATNTGVSAVIDARGEILASAGVHERTALAASVRPERAAQTLVLAWGEWLGPVALLLGALLLAAPGRSSPRDGAARAAPRRSTRPRPRSPGSAPCGATGGTRTRSSSG